MSEITLKSCLKSNSSTLFREVNYVDFNNLVFFEFPVELGDNPSVIDGAALTLGWKHESTHVIGVDYYEHLRQNRPRRTRKELIMSKAYRREILSSLGYTKEEMLQASGEAKLIRKSRLNNVADAGIIGTINQGFKSVIFKSSIVKDAGLAGLGTINEGLKSVIIASAKIPISLVGKSA
jgi:hypothetical protein